MLIVHALWEGGGDGEDHVGRYRLVHEHKFAITIITIMGCTIYDVIYKTLLYSILLLSSILGMDIYPLLSISLRI